MEEHEKYDFTIMSVNIRGINDRQKRRNVFRYLKTNKIDVCLLQETYSSPEIERIWKNEWGGSVYFGHGTRHSRGVMMLVRPGFDANVTDIYTDNIGRLMIAEVCIQDTIFKLLNIYAPNAEENQIHYYRYLKNIMDKRIDCEDKIIIGGDYNYIIDPSLDRKGGNIIKLTQARTLIEKTIGEVQENFNIVDIWRRKNPQKRRFTWRRKQPMVKSRLDYWLVSEQITDYVEKADIVSFIGTDHSAILLKLKSFSGNSRGRGLWRMNTSILDEQPYVEGIIENKTNWLEEITDVQDARQQWEWLKYRIRQFSMEYSKIKAKKLKTTETDLEQKLNQLLNDQDQETDIASETELENQILNIKTKLEEIADYKTRGLMLRSQATWHEKGEKSTKYFLQLESRNRIRKSVKKLQREDGTMTTDSDEILNMQAKFYENLYCARQPETEEAMHNYLAEIDTPKLTANEKDECEGLLTFEECYAIIKTFKNNKAPGNDGIPIEFYKKFFSIFGQIMVRSFNESFEHGELTTSQRQAVISLLDKGKDRTLLKNWRPISLLNTDYKIATKAIANRFIKFLPKLIDPNQVGYIKGRNITDNIRTTIDIINYLKDKEQPGVIINIDFEKAFDSVNWNFMLSTLEKFNFGPSLIKWIKTFYTNIFSCITNSGFTSKYFQIARGVRQGDPLSPYLFILMVEIMSNKIRQDKTINGIKLNDTTEIKLLQYADDTNGLLTNLKSAKHFLRVVKEFGTFSGLNLNVDKTEGMWLGSNRTNQGTPLGIAWPDRPLKILGVYVSYNKDACYMLNFENRINKAKRIIDLWSMRNLTIFGRIQIIKTFIQSQFLFVSSVLETPDKAMKQINSLIFKFVWKNKKERLKRSIIINSIRNGGLQVPDFETMVNTSKIKWIRKLASGVEMPSKIIIQKYLQKYGVDVDVLLYSNFSVRTLKALKCLPVFYYEMFKLWSEAGNNTTVKKNNVIWYNRNVCVNGQSIFYREFFKAGLWYTADLYVDVQLKEPIPFNTWVSRGVRKHNFIKWMGLLSKAKHLSIPAVMEPLGDEPNQLSLYSEIPIMLPKCNSKMIYQKLLEKKTGNHLQVPRISKYMDDTDNIDWSSIFIRGNKTPCDTKTKDFQYRFVQDLLSNQYWLHKWRIADSALCKYCNLNEETISHMFWECVNVQQFFRDFVKFLRDKGLVVQLNKEAIFIGVPDDFICKLIFMAKMYIYNKRIHDEPVVLAGFIGYMNKHKNIEHQVAKQNNMLDEWADKWSIMDS